MVDIVVVNYNTLPYIKKLIYSIKNNTDISHRIIIVDNNSTDGSIEYLRQEEKNVGISVIYFDNNYGYGAACNKGAKACNSKYIVFMNSDIEVTANWLNPIVKIFEENNKIAIVSPKMINSNNKITAGGVSGDNRGYNRRIRGWLEDNSNSIFNEHVYYCPTICGAMFVIRKDIFDSVGGFDENFFFYYEETDLCFSVRDAGYYVAYTGDVTIYHQWDSSPKTNAQKIMWARDSKILFEKKWGAGSG